jgi:hypothetical protein
MWPISLHSNLTRTWLVSLKTSQRGRLTESISLHFESSVCVSIYIYIYSTLNQEHNIFIYIYHFESSVQKNKKAVVMAIVYQIMCRHVKNSLPPCWMI